MGFYIFLPHFLTSPRLNPTSLAILAFAPLGSSEAPKVAKRQFPSGQHRLTVTALKYVTCGTGYWDTSLVGIGMFSPTSLVWRVNKQFISSLRVAFNVNV